MKRLLIILTILFSGAAIASSKAPSGAKAPAPASGAVKAVYDKGKAIREVADSLFAWYTEKHFSENGNKIFVAYLAKLTIEIAYLKLRQDIISTNNFYTNFYKTSKLCEKFIVPTDNLALEAASARNDMSAHNPSLKYLPDFYTFLGTLTIAYPAEDINSIKLEALKLLQKYIMQDFTAAAPGGL